MAFSIEDAMDSFFNNSGGGGIRYGGTNLSGGFGTISGGQGRSGGSAAPAPSSPAQNHHNEWMQNRPKSPFITPDSKVVSPEWYNKHGCYFMKGCSYGWAWDVGQGQVWKGPPLLSFDWYIP